MKTSTYLGALSRIAADLLRKHQNPHSIPVVYFSGTPNVGDLLNEYLIPRLSGKKIIQVSSSMTSHMRGIGSVIGSSSQFSHIWGSGSIDGRRPNRQIRKSNIYALRGTKTREMLSTALGTDLTHLPLGDPAVLMPHYYNPDVAKAGAVGIIPHFSDEAIITDYLASTGIQHARIISVRQQPEDFIAELCACDYVLSSSLHGLILADSYEVPNKWIIASNHLLGGAYKFEDYYSTTDGPEERAERVHSFKKLNGLLEAPDLVCKVKTYTRSRFELKDSFPFNYTDQY